MDEETPRSAQVGQNVIGNLFRLIEILGASATAGLLAGFFSTSGGMEKRSKRGYETAIFFILVGVFGGMLLQGIFVWDNLGKLPQYGLTPWVILFFAILCFFVAGLLNPLMLMYSNIISVVSAILVTAFCAYFGNGSDEACEVAVKAILAIISGSVVLLSMMFPQIEPPEMKAELQGPLVKTALVIGLTLAAITTTALFYHKTSPIDREDWVYLMKARFHTDPGIILLNP